MHVIVWFSKFEYQIFSFSQSFSIPIACELLQKEYFLFWCRDLPPDTGKLRQDGRVCSRTRKRNVAEGFMPAKSFTIATIKIAPTD